MFNWLTGCLHQDQSSVCPPLVDMDILVIVSETYRIILILTWVSQINQMKRVPQTVPSFLNSLSGVLSLLKAIEGVWSWEWKVISEKSKRILQQHCLNFSYGTELFDLTCGKWNFKPYSPLLCHGELIHYLCYWYSLCPQDVAISSGSFYSVLPLF